MNDDHLTSVSNANLTSDASLEEMERVIDITKRHIKDDLIRPGSLLVLHPADYQILQDNLPVVRFPDEQKAEFEPFRFYGHRIITSHFVNPIFSKPIAEPAPQPTPKPAAKIVRKRHRPQPFAWVAIAVVLVVLFFAGLGVIS